MNQSDFIIANISVSNIKIYKFKANILNRVKSFNLYILLITGLRLQSQ